MNSYIVLLRGVNVGGNNVLPMKELKILLECSGYNNIRTYIQSGNIVLHSNKRPHDEIGALINSKFGFQPNVLILSKSEFELAVFNNPYRGFEGKLVHVYFCQQTPTPNNRKLDAFASSSERYKLIDNVFYLHAPEGIGRSKLVTKIETCLGVSATGRNLNTVNKLIEMLSVPLSPTLKRLV